MSLLQKRSTLFILLLLSTVLMIVACSGINRLFEDDAQTPLPTPFPTYVYPSQTPFPSPTPLMITPWEQEIDTNYQCLTWESNQRRNFVNIRTGEILDYETFIPNYVAPNPSPTPTQSYDSERDTTDPLISPDGRYSIYRTGQEAMVENIDSGEVIIFDANSMFYHFNEAVWWSPNSTQFLYMDTDGDGLILFDADGTNARFIAQTAYPLSVVGWSPDGQYFVFENVEFLLEFWTIAADGSPYVMYSKPSQSSYRDFTWSRSGNHLAYFSVLRGVDGPIYRVHLEGLADNISLEFFLQTQISISDIDFIWSPDGRYVALQYGGVWSSAEHHVNVYAMDGGVVTDALYMTVDDNINLPQTVHWIGESNQLLSSRAYPYTLETYNIDTGIRNIFAPAMEAPPLIAPTGDRVALYIRDSDSNYRMDILLLTPDLNINNQERINVVNGASDMGWAFWSPTGEYLAVTWATDDDISREVYLTWMYADGTGIQVLDADYTDIRDLAWARDGQTLVYTASYGDNDVIEAVNLITGETRFIAEYASIRDLRYHAPDDSLAFIWDDGIYEGIARYSINGDLLDERRNTMVDNPDGTLSFWSPDYSVSAIKSRDNDTYLESLSLLSADGTVDVLLRDNLTGLGHPLWSPDGVLMAFTQSTDARSTSLQVVTADGQQVWSMPNYFPVYSPLEWIACAE